jgi:hypothetical protein
MSLVRASAVIVCVLSVSVLAQNQARDVATPPIAVPAPLEAQDPTPGGVAVAEPERVADRPSGRGAQTEMTGTNGELLLGSADGAPATGVLLGGFTGTPDVFARLGTNTSASSFNVTNASFLSLFKVRGDGYTSVRKDQDALSILEINNANAGTSTATAGSSLRFFQGTTLKASINSVGSGSTAAAGGANALQIWNHANSPMLFATNSIERMRIWGDGNITIGAPYNLGRLAILEYGDATRAVYAVHDVTVETNTSQSDYGLMAIAQHRVPVGTTNSGELVGMQIDSRNVNTQVGAGGGGSGTLANAFGARIFVGNDSFSAGTVTNANGVYVQIQSGPGTVTNGKAILIGDTIATNDYGIYQMAADDTNYFAGDIGIGTTTPAAKLHVVGNILATGSITGATVVGAVYQDVAEWVPATSDMTPGTVVVLNPEKSNEVMPSAHGYDTLVAGVVSAQPGVILGVQGTGKEQIATTGRVKVRVDTRSTPIRVGDLLVTSDVSGTAMRSEPMDINGRKFHQPGTIIGKALEPLDGGIGEILVLLSMQ